MRLFHRKNLGALIIACISALILDILIICTTKYPILLAIFIFDAGYSSIMLIGNIITYIQEKSIQKELDKLDGIFRDSK